MSQWLPPMLLAFWFGLPATAMAEQTDAGCVAGECHNELAPRSRRRAQEAAAKTGGEDPIEPEIYEHGPFREGRCGSCHRAHGERPSLLLWGDLPAGLYAPYSRSAYSACYGSCHPAALVEEERTTVATGFRNGDDNLHYRHVVRPRRGRSCRLCHAPHQASNRALIQRGMPFGNERLTLVFTPTKLGGKCTTSCHIAVEYDRDERIPSTMRLPEPPAGTELQ